MVGARKRPDIAFEALQELDADTVVLRGHKIPQGYLEVAAVQRTARKQGITRPGGDHSEICLSKIATEAEPEAPPCSPDARADELATGIRGPVQQQAIQNGARINDDRVVDVAAHAWPRWRSTRVWTNFLGNAIEQEGIGDDGFVRKAAATRLLPCEMLVIEDDFKSRAARRSPQIAPEGPPPTMANWRMVIR